jgi:predicted dehydrogenase
MKTTMQARSPVPTPAQPALTRRRFLGGALAAAATAASPAILRGRPAETPAPPAAPPVFTRKIKLGLIGCGGRGSWIGNLFKQHGGYEMHALADYSPAVAERCGQALGVDRTRRFSTLSGYKRLLESGVEAIAVETPPCFIPEQAQAGVEAGLHVYTAKPVAVDVPGCLQIQATGQAATRKQRCFLVDYQMPTDPANQEVLRRIRLPDFGALARVSSVGVCGGFADPPLTGSLESRIHNLIWVNDIVLGCDYIGNFDIHAIDAALWAIGERPVAATGASRVCRPQPHGDARDVIANVFEYASGLIHDHQGQALRNGAKDELSVRVYGTTGNALINYWGAATCKTGEDGFNGEVATLYEAGARSNIGTFYRNITEGNFENAVVRRAVDGALACILGREAAARRCRLTMTDLLKENRRLALDLQGLKI